MSERLDHTQWLKRGTSTFIPTDNAKTVEKIEPGIYNLRHNQDIGFYMSKKDVSLDALTKLPWPESTQVIDSIEQFWERKDKFKEYGFVHKRGIMLYGPPGTGKTSIINIICQNLIKNNNGVVIVLSTRDEIDLYHMYIAEVFRKIEPNTPIITLIEDIEGLCSSSSTETQLINILDGIEQLDNVVYIATTNFIERLSDRLTNRPNRFDRKILIGFPTPDVRRAYITFKLHKEDLENIDLEMWIEKTHKFTIAHIGELVKSVIIMGNTFEESIEMLSNFKNKANSHDYNKGEENTTIGFGTNKSIEQSSAPQSPRQVGFAGRQSSEEIIGEDDTYHSKEEKEEWVGPEDNECEELCEEQTCD